MASFNWRNPWGGPYVGIQIFDNELLGDPYEDWSQVRSPGRAARRRKRGLRQRIVIRYRANGKAIHDKVRNIIYMHPDDRRRLETALGADRAGGL